MTLHKYSEIHYIDWMEMYKLDTNRWHFNSNILRYDTLNIFSDTWYRLNGNV